MKFRCWHKDHNRHAPAPVQCGPSPCIVKLREGSLPAVARTHRGTRSRRRAAARGGGDTAAAARSIHQHLVTKVPTSVEIMSTLWEHVSTVWCVVRCDPMSRTQTVTLLSSARWHPLNLRQGCAPAAPAALLNVERVEVRSRVDMYVFNARYAYRIEIIYNRNKITVKISNTLSTGRLDTTSRNIR